VGSLIFIVLALVLSFVLQHKQRKILLSLSRKNVLHTEQYFCPVAYLGLFVGPFAFILLHIPLQLVVNYGSLPDNTV